MKTTPEDLIGRTTDLVSLPDIYLRVRGVMDDPDSSMKDMADAVAHDPSLSARLLKLANSAFFGFTTKIDTVARATNVLGFHQIHDLVLATVVADAFSKTSTNAITMHDFWTDSVHCGLLAKTLARDCGMLDHDRFFLEGLLHDIGHLIMDQAIPRECAQAFECAHERGLPVHLVERELFGCDYAEVGAALMEGWNFPGGLVSAVRWQNDPAAADYVLDAAVTHAAVTLLRGDRADTDAEGVFALLEPSAVETTGVTADRLVYVADQATEALGATYEALFPEARLCA